MDFTDVVREQVSLLSYGSQVDHGICAQGAAVIQELEPAVHLNCFYPFEHGFRYSRDVLRKLEALYASKGMDGCVFDCSHEFPGLGFMKVAAVLVPCTAVEGHVDEGFSCVRTSDVDRWCDVYVMGSPNLGARGLRERTGRLLRFREVEMYLFKYRDEVIGAGSLVRTMGDAWLANGFSIRKEFRGGILGRARAVRMATDSDVIALTDLRFARAIERALGGARILGVGQFVRIASLAHLLSGQPSEDPVPA